MAAQKYEPEVAPVRSKLDIQMKYPAGLYMGEWLRKLADEEKMMAIRCRGCRRILFPPQCVCTHCHAENIDDIDWLEVGPEGTLILWIAIKMPWLDPRTGEFKDTGHPVGIFLLDAPDGGGAVYMHFLEETDMEKLKQDMRVRPVFKPRQEREYYPTDILYFRIVDG
jgi:uncharacterized OB-fold protein